MNKVVEFFSKLFNSDDWVPRWQAGKWSSFHIWLYILGDAMVWSAYFTIPLVIIKYILRKKDGDMVRLYLLLAAFFLINGASYFVDAVSFWVPLYRLNALIIFFTGITSWGIVFYISRYLPLIVSVRSATSREAENEYLKKIAKELRESSDEIETIYKNAPDAVIVINSKGFVKKINPAAEKMFGWKEAEILGKVLNDTIVPEDLRHVHLAEMKKFLKTGTSDVLNRTSLQTVMRKDGTLFQVEFTVSPVLIQDDFLFIGFIRDVTEIKKAELKLRENEERYRLLTTEVQDYAIIMVSTEGEIQSWNEGAQNITGYTQGEIMGKHFSVFYPGGKSEKNTVAETLDIAATEGRHQSEQWQVKKDGSYFWASEVITVLKKEGKIIGYSKITKDISEIKTAEKNIRLLNSSLEQRVKDRTEDLAQSETKYRLLFENSPIPMWVLELPSQGFLDVNGAAIAHYGYTREEFLSMTALEIRPDDEKFRFLNLDRSGTGVRRSGIWKHLKKDQSIIYVDIFSHQLLIKNKPARLVVSIDVTERKKAEQRLDVALEAGKIGIWELDMQNDVSVRNMRHDQIFGYDEAIPKWGITEFLSHVFEEDVEDVKKAFEDARQTGILYVETRIVLPDNKTKWIIATGKMMEDSQDKRYKMLGTVIDFTELKDAEDRIKILNNDLEERVQLRTRELHAANKELESFSYSVSHDLRAPLRAIHGYAQILNENCKVQLDEEGQRMLSRLTFNTNKMSVLIDDLLEFSRLGKASLRKTSVNLTEIAREVVGELSQTAPHYHHEVVVGELGMASADKIIIRHVFENLVSNAIKYSHKKDNPVVEIGAMDTEKGTVYFVKDNGAGFDMVYADKLFGVFQRLHRQDQFEGIGVGLAIVQKIILKHHGEVWARAGVDVGATFYFTLGK